MRPLVTPLGPGDPEMLGHYIVRARLGEGGMGVVYLATDPAGVDVAIKAIHRQYAANPEFLRRFRREVHAARRVPRFCTAAVIDDALDTAAPYLVTEYVDGPSLAIAVTDEAPLAGQALTALAVGVAAALTAIHEVGVVHRDLKPGNVLLSSAGPRVIDFGIASAVDATSHTLTGAMMGTPAYMAPEQISGDRATAATDVFAWGGVVAFAATGEGPFGNTTSIPAVMHRVLHEQPRIDSLPVGLREIVAAAMAKDPAHRPTSRELLQRVLAYAEQGVAADVIDHATITPGQNTTVAPPAYGLPTSPPPTAPPPHLSAPTRPPPRQPVFAPPPPPRKARVVLPVVLAVAAMLAVIGGVAVADPFGWRDADQRTDSSSESPGPTPKPDPVDDAITLENYRGEEAATAKATLDDAGIDVRVAQRTSTEAQVGLVIGLDPAPGTELQEGDQVTLFVGDGPAISNTDVAVFKLIRGKDFLNVATLIARAPDGTETVIGTGDSPDISANGQLIAYVDTSTASNSQVVTVGANGKGRRTVTDVTVGSVNYLSVSPDGSQIAYANNTGGIFVINADGSNKRTVADVDAFELDWSPDGKSLVFRRYDVSPQALWIVNVDGSNLHELKVNLSGDASPFAPAWSPDGRTIAFSSFDGGVLTVPAGGGRTTSVSPVGTNVSWTTDGRLTYGAGEEVRIVEADGTDTVVPNLTASGPVNWGAGG